MKIAVHIDWETSFSDDEFYFQYEVLKRLITYYPEHEFIFFSALPVATDLLVGKNSRIIIVPKLGTQWRWWASYRLKRLVQKYKAALLISCTDLVFSHSSILQCLLVPDVGVFFPSYSGKIPRWVAKNQVKAAVKKATWVITTSKLYRQLLLDHCRIAGEKIAVVYGAARKTAAPLEEIQKKAVKDQYTAGKNYFICPGNIPSAVINELLKAFTVFKKRQKSDWKLVLAGFWNLPFEKRFSAYKFRHDVVWLKDITEQETQLLNSAAYAVVYPSSHPPEIAALDAMKMGIPVIAAANSVIEEIGGDSILYINTDFRDIGDKLMLLYKDESARSRLIEKAKNKELDFNWDKTARQVGEIIKLKVES